MNIGLAIFRLVPAGGLERHAIRIAAALVDRGHEVTLYTTAGMETAPAGVTAVKLDAAAATNHTAMAAFSARLAQIARGRHDALVGFQKFTDLDVLFCADWCYVDKPRSWIVKQLPRYRTLSNLEQACFGVDSATRLLLLSELQRAAYESVYPMSAARMTVLPPTIDLGHRAPTPPTMERRNTLRAARDLALEAVIWLWIGLQPRVKGLDRVIAALAREPRAVLLICGTDATQRDLAAPLASMRRVGSADRIRVLGPVAQDELNALFALSDLLVHPARLDVTGTVILEAMVHGLPVVTTANCGFSTHVAAADAGVVLPVPFEQAALERALADADPARRTRWAQNAFAYGADPALYSGIDRACELIEAAGQAKLAQALP